MAQLLSTVSALTVLLVLLLAATEHAVRPRVLANALRAQGVVPGRALLPVALLVTATETALMGVGAYGAIVGADGVAPLRAALAGSMVLFLAYGAYTTYLLRARPGVPCGCSGQDVEVNGWVAGRAVVLAALAALALVAGARTVFVEPTADRLAVSIAAAITFAILLWQLPTAMHDPLQTALRERRRHLLAAAEEHR